jgi:hypothetical protein
VIVALQLLGTADKGPVTTGPVEEL